MFRAFRCIGPMVRRGLARRLQPEDNLNFKIEIKMTQLSTNTGSQQEITLNHTATGMRLVTHCNVSRTFPIWLRDCAFNKRRTFHAPTSPVLPHPARKNYSREPNYKYTIGKSSISTENNTVHQPEASLHTNCPAMAIQILSDLHLEFGEAYDKFEVVPCARYLALLGDIGLVVKHKDCFSAFLRRQLEQFATVLFVPGNHEAYGSTWSATRETLKAFERDARESRNLGDFILVDRSAFRVPGKNITILGCSLFSSVPEASMMRAETGLNDFFSTSDWTVRMHNEAHQRDLTWLNKEIERLQDTNTQVIILSHWSPSTDPRAVEPRHADSPIRFAFSTDLSEQPCFKSGNVVAWAFGHTHYNCDFEVARQGNVAPLRLLTNQRGYDHAQADGFSMAKAIDLARPRSRNPWDFESAAT